MSVVAEGLVVDRGGRPVLAGVDLRVPIGTSCAVVGPNGAGKSTLLAALAGLLPTTAGTVRVDGVAPATLERTTAARHVSLMPQAIAFPFAWTALDVVLMGAAGMRSPFGRLSRDERERARRALASVDAAHLAERSITRLSGGERQRVHFAMQLMQDAAVLLLDEPTSALDFAGVTAVLGCVRDRCDQGRTAIAALHDLNVAAAGFDAIALLHEGRITAFGRPDEVLSSDALRAAYGDAYRLVRVDGEAAILPARPASSAPD